MKAIYPEKAGEPIKVVGDFFLGRGMHRISSFWPVGIGHLSAHGTVALVHKGAFGTRPETRKGAGGAVLHRLFCGHEFPGAHDLVKGLPTPTGQKPQRRIERTRT